MKKLIIMPVFLKSVACSTFILFACLAFSSFLRASAAAPEPIDTDLKAASDYSEWFKIHQMCYNNKDVSVVGNYIDKLNLSKNDLALHLNRRDESGYSALDYAIMSGDILKVMLLLENGANPIPCFITALAPWFRESIAEMLAIRCFMGSFDISYQGFSLVHRVAQLNRGGQSLVFIVSELQKRNILPAESFNFASSSGMTPLHCAAAAGMLANVYTLSRYDAVIDARDHVGNTPLHLAAKSGHADVVRALIRLGADVDVVNSHAKTPLSYARIYDRQDVADILQGCFSQQSTDQSESDSEDNEYAESVLEDLFASFDIKLQSTSLHVDEEMPLVKDEGSKNSEPTSAVFENKHLFTSSEIKKQPILGGIDSASYLSDDESFMLKSYSSEEMCASSDSEKSESSDALERLFASFEKQGTCAVSE
ncbi:ankyrin repeat domain-containing protein [bacterium]|nr:MAG: ankyrin repeat domain-containing protein [bacterium]